MIKGWCWLTVHLDDCYEVSGHVSWQQVLQQDLVDALHGVHTLLLALQTFPPEPLHPGEEVLVPRHHHRQHRHGQEAAHCGQHVLGRQVGCEAEAEHHEEDQLGQVVDTAELDQGEHQGQCQTDVYLTITITITVT